MIKKMNFYLSIYIQQEISDVGDYAIFEKGRAQPQRVPRQPNTRFGLQQLLPQVVENLLL